MELADPKVVCQLIAECDRTTRKGAVRTASVRTPSPRVFRPRRCRCGVCDRCVASARWEQIFNERFADPGYYGLRLTQGGSSLSGL
jgi:hypothetical protein